MSSNKDELKIVVVDDSDFNRRSVIEILEDEGFNVVGQADNAEEAFKVIQSTACNLAIIDVVMPEYSGIELAEKIGELNKTVPIIMMSSLTMEHIIIESISNGAVDFLQKPFKKEDLLRSVHKVAEDLEKEG